MEVKEALGNHENEKESDEPTLFPAKFPAQIRKVTLQAGPKKSEKEGNVELKDRLMMKGLESLNIETPNMNGVQVIVLDRSPHSSMLHDIKQEWLENIATFVPLD